MKLLTLSNTKILKGIDQGYITYGLHLAPSTLSGRNVCPNASKGCAEACLNTAGRGIMQMVQDARINKTNKFFKNKFEFVLELSKDVVRGINYSLPPGIRGIFYSSLVGWNKVIRDLSF